MRGLPLTLAPAETELRLRVLVDRSVVEVFAAGGRVVATARDYPALDEVAVRAWARAPSPLVLTSASAWSMGCGWEDEE